MLRTVKEILLGPNWVNIDLFGHLNCFYSTASSGLNSLSAVVLEDIVKKIAPQTGDRQATLVSKVIGKLSDCRSISTFYFVPNRLPFALNSIC